MRLARRDPSFSFGCGAGRRSSTLGTPSLTRRSIFRGPFASIPTRITVSASANCFRRSPPGTDQIAVLRSLHTTSNDHGVAGTIGLTGSMAGSVNLGGQWRKAQRGPTLGAVVARAKRSARRLAPFHGHRRQAAPGQEGYCRRKAGGALGALYDPFVWNTTPNKAPASAALRLPDNLTPERLTDATPVALVAVRARRVEIAADTIDDYRTQALGAVDRARRAADV